MAWDSAEEAATANDAEVELQSRTRAIFTALRT